MPRGVCLVVVLPLTEEVTLGEYLDPSSICCLVLGGVK